jgi:hypothetical protein
MTRNADFKVALRNLDLGQSKARDKLGQTLDELPVNGVRLRAYLGLCFRVFHHCDFRCGRASISRHQRI